MRNYRLENMIRLVMLLFPYWELKEVKHVVYKPSVRQPPLLVKLLIFFIHLRWYDRYVALLKMSLLPLKWK